MSTPLPQSATGDQNSRASTPDPDKVSPRTAELYARYIKTPKSKTTPEIPLMHSGEVHINDGICPHTIITPFWTPKFEDYALENPDEDEELFSSRLDLIKKYKNIAKTDLEVAALAAQVAQSEATLGSAVSQIETLKKQKDELATVYASKKSMISEIQATSQVLTGGGNMSAAAMLKARVDRLKINKLESEILESEIDVLKADMALESATEVAQAEVDKFRSIQGALEKLTVNLAEVKSEYAKEEAAWHKKYSGYAIGTGGSRGVSPEASTENATLNSTISELQKSVEVLQAEAAASAEESRLLKEENRVLKEVSASPNAPVLAHEVEGFKKTISEAAAKIDAQSKEIESLKVISDTVSEADSMILALSNEIESLKAIKNANLEADAKIAAQSKEIESLKALITRAQEDKNDSKLATKINILEGKIEMMKPIYDIGRSIRYRNNFSILRKKFEGQNVECNFDKYEAGYDAYFGGHVVADSTLYQAGFDDEDTSGRNKNDFLSLHHDIPPNMVWDHRDDFKILAKILDMASNMKVYVKAAEKTDDEYGTVEFKELFEKVMKIITPAYQQLAITSDKEFMDHSPDLVDALNAMLHIEQEVRADNYRERRKGIEDSWVQPYENAWMDFEDVLYEANRLGMF